MKKIVGAIVALSLVVPASAFAAPTPKGVAWQLTNAMQKRERFLGKHFGFYGAKCLNEVPGKSWTCTIKLRTPSGTFLFPDVKLSGGVYSFGSPTVL